MEERTKNKNYKSKSLEKEVKQINTLKSEADRRPSKGNRSREVNGVLKTPPVSSEVTILNFLEKHNTNGNQFSISEISVQTEISYPTCLKWIDVLLAKEKIKQRDYGNVRLISLK